MVILSPRTELPVKFLYMEAPKKVTDRVTPATARARTSVENPALFFMAESFH